MRWCAFLQFSSFLARFIAVILIGLALHHATAVQYSVGLLVASGCAAAGAAIWVRREIGPATVDLRLMFRRMREGFGFSFAGSTTRVYNDVDKAMLSHYGLNRENGFYTLAYRIVDITTAPIAAMDFAVLPRFFRHGNQRMQSVFGLAIKSACLAAVLGALVAVCTLVVAPIVPRVVGRDFDGVLIALRWLCWLPLLRGIHQMTGCALTGSGWQGRRTAAQFVVAGVNLP